MLIDLTYLFEKYHIESTGILHIGSHIGQEAEAYHKHGLKVIWFEANRLVYSQLLRNVVKYTGTISINACISDKDGDIVPFNISNNEGQSSSILDFDTHTKEHPGIVFTSKTRLQTRRVDSILNERKIDPAGYNFVNIDIQGAELMALKSMDLSHIDYAYIEVNEKHLYKNCPLIGDIDNYLSRYDLFRVETKMTGNGWGDAFYIRKQIERKNMVTVPKQFQPPHPFPYPGDNEIDFERWYLLNYTGIEGRTYLPVMWTAFYCNSRTNIHNLQKFIDGLDKSKKYYTIVQYDDGILNNLTGINIKVFSMSGPGDYYLPLICQEHKYPAAVKRDIFCSFMGRNTHPIRKELLKIKEPGWMITDRIAKLPEFCNVLSRSVFTLCPRGYGPNSFRIMESIQYKSIPVYVSDIFIEGHGIPFETYGVKINSSDVHIIPEILKSISSDEIKEKQGKLQYVFDTYYSYFGNKELIEKNI